MPVSFSCELCGATRMVPPSRAVRAGRYCSRACSGLAARTQITMTCARCGTDFERRRDQLRERNYCSRVCTSSSRSDAFTVWGKNFDAEARRQYHREYQAKNRQHINALCAAWGKRNRATKNVSQQRRRAAGTLTPSEWRGILAAHGSSCAHCGATERLEMDHIVPVSAGGRTDRDNVQPLCRRCNAAKGAKLMLAIHNIDVVLT